MKKVHQAQEANEYSPAPVKKNRYEVAEDTSLALAIKASEAIQALLSEARASYDGSPLMFDIDGVAAKAMSKLRGYLA